MDKITKMKPIFDEDFNTNFKVMKDVILFSAERRVYVRLCTDAEDIPSKKARLSAVITSREEPAIVFLDEGYNQKSDAHYIVYT